MESSPLLFPLVKGTWGWGVGGRERGGAERQPAVSCLPFDVASGNCDHDFFSMKQKKKIMDLPFYFLTSCKDAK